MFDGKKFKDTLEIILFCGFFVHTLQEDPLDDESLSFLKSLKHLNPEKLLQLKERLVTPLNSTGPVPQPTFPGAQEFYKEFILNAQNWKFYVILENSLISEIMERNETQFAHSEIESTGTFCSHEIMLKTYFSADSQ